MHGRSVGILVEGYHYNAIALQFDSHFLTKFATSEQ